MVVPEYGGFMIQKGISLEPDDRTTFLNSVIFVDLQHGDCSKSLKAMRMNIINNSEKSCLHPVSC